MILRINSDKFRKELNPMFFLLKTVNVHCEEWDDLLPVTACRLILFAKALSDERFASETMMGQAMI
jgi:hypothetical protein